jgi:hypothetical protein
MRYEDWPRTVSSGWRVTAPSGPVNQFGWRGQARQKRGVTDFVVVLTGASQVECLSCPPEETLDAMLENALRQYNPKARVVTLGSAGYGQDQEFLALQEFFGHAHADLVIAWTSPEDDVPANTFRTAAKRPGEIVLKPTFALSGKQLRGPTEGIGQVIYKSKISTLVLPLFIDLDRNWTILLPAAEPGAAEPPPDVTARLHVDDPLEQQRSHWSIWLTPRPARVAYGISLTQALFQHMRDLSTLNGARFAVLVTPSDPNRVVPDGGGSGRVALEHRGRWFVADPAMRDAAVADLVREFDPIALPTERNERATERQVMARLAEALNQSDLLNEIQIARPRH